MLGSAHRGIGKDDGLHGTYIVQSVPDLFENIEDRLSHDATLILSQHETKVTLAKYVLTTIMFYPSSRPMTRGHFWRAGPAAGGYKVLRYTPSYNSITVAL